MDPSTLKALLESIRHHEENAKAETPEEVKLGADHCALCKLFYAAKCFGCPVASATGKRYCENTPYEPVGQIYNYWNNFSCLDSENRKHRERFHMAELREVQFLKSLLPKGEKQ